MTIFELGAFEDLQIEAPVPTEVEVDKDDATSEAPFLDVTPPTATNSSLSEMPGSVEDDFQVAIDYSFILSKTEDENPRIKYVYSSLSWKLAACTLSWVPLSRCSNRVVCVLITKQLLLHTPALLCLVHHQKSHSNVFQGFSCSSVQLPSLSTLGLDLYVLYPNDWTSLTK
ncbi:hypothetical protein CYMTET_52344 [Cymbomonas tetramitiformis]|uniref:Uncharacterized protein n=1 Tax=Cymbomonas tetramitiformis TaxID=36881 RepID=A0AAE0BJ94_9CHLO|nr:hypothetical protein CYMTET_52344 [Cymbomonas tetramitiformis]